MTDYERIKREYDLSLLEKGRLMDKVWPIGSIYMSIDSTDPAIRFGGRWVRIEGRFLLGASKDHPVNEESGEETHVLSVDEMPEHAHDQAEMQYGHDWLGVSGQWSASSSGDVTHRYVTAAAGGGQPHNNMPPYLAVYIWKRVA